MKVNIQISARKYSGGYFSGHYIVSGADIAWNSAQKIVQEYLRVAFPFLDAYHVGHCYNGRKGSDWQGNIMMNYDNPDSSAYDGETISVYTEHYL